LKPITRGVWAPIGERPIALVAQLSAAPGERIR